MAIPAPATRPVYVHVGVPSPCRSAAFGGLWAVSPGEAPGNGCVPPGRGHWRPFHVDCPRAQPRLGRSMRVPPRQRWSRSSRASGPVNPAVGPEWYCPSPTRTASGPSPCAARTCGCRPGPDGPSGGAVSERCHTSPCLDLEPRPDHSTPQRRRRARSGSAPRLPPMDAGRSR